MKILIVGDVYSKLGRAALEENIKKIKQEQTINFIIINGENISHGKGMNQNHYKWLMSLGANVITMGNHTWNNRQIYDYIKTVGNNNYSSLCDRLSKVCGFSEEDDMEMVERE